MGVTANVLVGSATVTITCAAAQSGGLQEAATATITGFYTVDGVTVTVRSSFADIKVEENVGTIIRRLVDQEVDVTLTFAEAELDNLVAAIPGSSISGAVVTIGGGFSTDPLLQIFELDVEGIDPAGAARTWNFPEVNPTGEVGIPYKKGEISVIPVKFSALVADTGIFATVTDA